MFWAWLWNCFSERAIPIGCVNLLFLKKIFNCLALSLYVAPHMPLPLFLAVLFCRHWAAAGDIRASGCNMAHLMSAETERVKNNRKAWCAKINKISMYLKKRTNNIEIASKKKIKIKKMTLESHCFKIWPSYIFVVFFFTLFGAMSLSIFAFIAPTTPTSPTLTLSRVKWPN